MDVLAVPNVCGSGDVSNTSNYWFRPIKIEVRDTTAATMAAAQELRRQHTGFRNQRKPEQFKVSAIKADRELRKDPSFVGQFVNTPMKLETFEVELSAQDQAVIASVLERGGALDEEDAFRAAVMTWYTRNRTPQIVREFFDIRAPRKVSA